MPFLKGLSGFCIFVANQILSATSIQCTLILPHGQMCDQFIRCFRQACQQHNRCNGILLVIFQIDAKLEESTMCNLLHTC